MKESVSLANMRLSAVDGTAFFDAGVADILTDHIGEKLYIRDSAGATIWGWIKAAGTGETLGSEQVANATMETGDPPTDWSPINAATLSQQSDERTGGTGSASLQAITGTGLTCVSQTFLSDLSKNGALFKVSGWGKAVVGTLLALRLVDIDGDGNNDIINNDNSGTWVNGEVYHTFTGSEMRIIAQATSGGSGTIRLDDVSAKQVLTPSTTGVTIVSTSGGTTYNWTAKDTGFDYNDASGYEISTSRLGHNPFYGPMC